MVIPFTDLEEAKKNRERIAGERKTGDATTSDANNPALVSPPAIPRGGRGVRNMDIRKWYADHKDQILAEVKVNGINATFTRWKIPVSRWYALKKDWGINGVCYPPSRASSAKSDTTSPRSMTATEETTSPSAKPSANMLNLLKACPLLELNLGAERMIIMDEDLCVVDDAEFEMFWLGIGKIIRRRAANRIAARQYIGDAD